jgi:septum formation protein
MALWLADRPLVLASSSQVRRKILQAAGIPLDVHPADVDERALERGLGDRNPPSIASLLAGAKAEAVAETLPGRIVLGADQTLACGNRMFSKPENRAAAREQLTMLRGGVHELHAALVVQCDATPLFTHVETARLVMRNFTDAFLDLAGATVLQSVGGYQLEGTGIHLFEKIEGDYFTILGLPLLPLLGFFRKAGYLTA